MKHSVIAPGFIHTPFNWVYASAADRIADRFIPDDLQKVALDLDTGNAFVLMAVATDGVGTWVTLARDLPLNEIPPPIDTVSMDGQRLIDLADATAGTDALNRETGDGRYDAIGAAAAAQAAAEAASLPAGTTLDAVPGAVADVALHGHKLTGVGDATAGTDALNRETGDGRYDALGAGAMALAPTAVKSAAYAAAAGEFVPVDISGGNVPITLPTAPGDRTRIGVKVVKVDGAHANSCSVARGGTDVFNIAAGSTALTLSALFQGVLLQYKASSGIWYVSTADTPLGTPLGAAKLGADGTLTGAGGSGLPASVENVSSITQRATVYVTAAGNDSNDGLTWGHAKATIPAAIAAIPLAADGVSRPGIVEVGAFPTSAPLTVSSFSRVDASCGINSGSTTITDSSIAAGDLGGIVTITGNMQDDRNGYTILTVNPGVSFTTNAPLGALGATGTISLTIVRPAVTIPPACEVRGRGRKGGNNNIFSIGRPTCIVDSGNGITFSGPNGYDNDQHTTWQARLSDMSINGGGSSSGGSGTICGYFGFDVAALFIERCDFEFHGQWGAILGANAAVAGTMRDCNFQYNGRASATVPTGGLYIEDHTVMEYRLERVRSILNWGFGAHLAAEVAGSSCNFSSTATTAFTGNSDLPTSGYGLIVGDDAGALAAVVLTNVEWQNNATGAIYVKPGASLQLLGGEGTASTAPYSIALADQTSVLTVDSVSFSGATTASIHLVSGTIPQIAWRNCRILTANDPLFLKVGSAGLTLPTTAALGAGSTVFSALGLTGAAAASRYAGATASGAPTTGTFLLGDWVIDQTGSIWICTTAGSPGTWTATGGSTITGGANTFTGLQTAPDFKASGLTGATAGARFVGATAAGAPTTGTFLTGDYIIDQSGAVWVCTAGGTPGTWTKGGGALLGSGGFLEVAQRPDLQWMPSASVENFSRFTRLDQVSALTSGTLFVCGGAILQAGVARNSISFISSATPAGTPLNQWFCLVDQAGNVLAKTNDDTTTAWAANAKKTLSFPSAYTPANDIPVYVGIMVKATTTPTLLGVAQTNNLPNVAPYIASNSTSGLTNPASLGGTCVINTPTASGVPYCYVT